VTCYHAQYIKVRASLTEVIGRVTCTSGPSLTHVVYLDRAGVDGHTPHGPTIRPHIMSISVTIEGGFDTA
jgi:hypothetical protein